MMSATSPAVLVRLDQGGGVHCWCKSFTFTGPLQEFCLCLQHLFCLCHLFIALTLHLKQAVLFSVLKFSAGKKKKSSILHYAQK